MSLALLAAILVVGCVIIFIAVSIMIIAAISRAIGRPMTRLPRTR